MYEMLEIALLVFGAFALLYPNSPFALAMLRERGPRRDHAVLLRSEIRESARGFAICAIACFAGTAAIHLATRTGAPRPNQGTPLDVAIVTCAGVGSWFAWHAARAWLSAALRTAARDEEILLARVALTDASDAAPPGTRFDARGVPIPAAPLARPADVEQLLGGRVAVLLLVLGVGTALGGAALIGWTLTNPDELQGIGVPAAMCAIGIALVALALRLDRIGARR